MRPKQGIERARRRLAGVLVSALSVVTATWPAGAELSDGGLKLEVTDSAVMLEARTVPLDRLLARLGEAFDFDVRVRCRKAGCPTFEGRLTGRLEDILAWVLHDRHFSLIYGPAAGPDSPPRLERLIVLAREPDARSGLSENAVSSEQEAAAVTVWRNNPRASPSWGPAAPLGGNAMRQVLATAGLDERGFPGQAAGDSADASSEPGTRDMRAFLRALPLLAPLPRYRVTSRFGARPDPINGGHALHYGIDLAAPERTRVLATAPGVVTSAAWQGDYGHMVEIDHGLDITTRYAHLAETLVRPGQVLPVGAPLGVIGDTGRSTGRHLHYEVRIKGRPVDPSRLLEAGLLDLRG